MISLSHRLKHILKEAGLPLHYNEVWEKYQRRYREYEQLPSVETITRTLRKMAEDGEIKRVGAGIFAIKRSTEGMKTLETFFKEEGP